jgi:hypothetical protein
MTRMNEVDALVLAFPPVELPEHMCEDQWAGYACYRPAGHGMLHRDPGGEWWMIHTDARVGARREGILVDDALLRGQR